MQMDRLGCRRTGNEGAMGVVYQQESSKLLLAARREKTFAHLRAPVRYGNRAHASIGFDIVADKE